MSLDETSFLELLAALDERVPTVPDELVQHLTRNSGCEVHDSRAIRLLGLATQRFISEILTESVRLSRVRDRLPFSRLKDLGFNPKDKTRVLLIDELVSTLKQFGIHGHHVPYYLQSVDQSRP